MGWVNIKKLYTEISLSAFDNVLDTPLEMDFPGTASRKSSGCSLCVPLPLSVRSLNGLTDASDTEFGFNL